MWLGSLAYLAINYMFRIVVTFISVYLKSLMCAFLFRRRRRCKYSLASYAIECNSWIFHNSVYKEQVHIRTQPTNYGQMHQIDRATTPTTGEKHTALNELTNTGQTNIHINLTTNNLIASNFLFTAHPLKCESRKLELAIGQEVCAS